MANRKRGEGNERPAIRVGRQGKLTLGDKLRQERRKTGKQDPEALVLKTYQVRQETVDLTKDMAERLDVKLGHYVDWALHHVAEGILAGTIVPPVEEQDVAIRVRSIGRGANRRRLDVRSLKRAQSQSAPDYRDDTST